MTNFQQNFHIFEPYLKMSVIFNYSLCYRSMSRFCFSDKPPYSSTQETTALASQSELPEEQAEKAGKMKNQYPNGNGAQAPLLSFIKYNCRLPHVLDLFPKPKVTLLHPEIVQYSLFYYYIKNLFLILQSTENDSY